MNLLKFNLAIVGTSRMHDMSIELWWAGRQKRRSQFFCLDFLVTSLHQGKEVNRDLEYREQPLFK